MKIVQNFCVDFALKFSCAIMKFHHSIFRSIFDHSQVSFKIIQRHVHSFFSHFETVSYITSRKNFQKKNRKLKISSTTNNYSFTFIIFIILFLQFIDHLTYITILLYFQNSYNAFRFHQLFFFCFNSVLFSWFNWSSWWLIDRRSLNLLFSMMIYECENFILSWFVNIHKSMYEIFQIFSFFFFRTFSNTFELWQTFCLTLVLFSLFFRFFFKNSRLLKCLFFDVFRCFFDSFHNSTRSMNNQYFVFY